MLTIDDRARRLDWIIWNHQVLTRHFPVPQDVALGVENTKCPPRSTFRAWSRQAVSMRGLCPKCF